MAAALLLLGAAPLAIAQDRDHRRPVHHYHRPPPPPSWGYGQPTYAEAPPPVVYAPPEPPPLVYSPPGVSLNFSFR